MIAIVKSADVRLSKIHLISALLFISGVAFAADEKPKAKEYPFGPDSEQKEGVSKGTVINKTWKSKVFPDTTREYSVYVPAQYKANGKEKAAVMVFQDELWWLWRTEGD